MEQLKYTDILRLKNEMSVFLNGKPYRIKILSNITVNILKEVLEYILIRNKISPYIQIGDYDNIVQESLKCEDFDLVIIIYDIQVIIDKLDYYFEDSNEEQYILIKNKIIDELNLSIKNLEKVPSIIINTLSSLHFVNSYFKRMKIDNIVNEINDYLFHIGSLNLNLLDTNKLISHIGVENSLDHRLFYSSKAPYTLSFLKKYCSVVETIIFKNTGRLKKAIVFDCDNTLWKGIIGEDGAENIDMSSVSSNGLHFYKVQLIAKFLSKNGIILGLCSKNNYSDVENVLANHPDMVLTNEYITIKKINWENKADNLSEIARELNIGLDSIIFIDDSTFEINLIKNQLPEVLTMQVPEKLYEYPDLFLKLIYKYFDFSKNIEDLSRMDLYKQQKLREEDRVMFNSLEDYLSSLNITISIVVNDQYSISRISQLTQKTNQFNLTTKRYTENEISLFISSSEFDVFSLSVKDKYGDNGLTGVCILKYLSPREALIDTLLMSCRIIGRNIEYSFIDFIISQLRNQGYYSVNSEFIQTKKNEQVKNFFDMAGFKLEQEFHYTRKYSLILDHYKPISPEYIHFDNK